MGELSFCSGFDVEPWARLLGFGGAVALTMVSLAALQQEISGRPEEEFAAGYLVDEEVERLQTYSYPKRRIQWLGGRLAAKHAAMQLMDNAHSGPVHPWQEFRVTADETGRPYLQPATPGQGRQGLPDISISHSGGLAAALAATTGRCGVDIQKITDSVVKVRERFAASSEQDILEALVHAGPASCRLTLLWAAKEAVRKTVGTRLLPGFLGIGLTNATQISAGSAEGFGLDFLCQGQAGADIHRVYGRVTLPVLAMFYEDAVLAFTIL